MTKYIPRILAVLAVFLSPSLHADWADYYLNVECNPAKNLVRITPAETQSQESDKSDKECVFSNGRTVKVRIGVGPAYPYGEGGADPDRWLSIWIDKKKVVSKFMYYTYWSCGREPKPKCDLYFEVDSQGYRLCRGKQGGGHLCDTTTNNKFPNETDPLEYPENQAKRPATPGTIVIEYASDRKFCERFLLNSTTYKQGCRGCPFEFEGAEKINWNRDVEEAHRDLHPHLWFTQIDIDNDGIADSVYRYYEDTHYRDGDVYFAFMKGKRPPTDTSIKLPTLVATASKIYPYSWTKCPESTPSTKFECPTIDYGSYAFKHMRDDQSQKTPMFELRYLHMNLLRADGKTYFTTSSMQAEWMHLQGVLRPEPDGSVTDMCYFNTVRQRY
jgi:hypothetical protein